MQVTYFDRHTSMDSATRKLILRTINSLSDCPLGHSTSTIENWLYGSFDGYDYSKFATISHELESVTETDLELGNQIREIFQTISQYPRTQHLNNNNL